MLMKEWDFSNGIFRTYSRSSYLCFFLFLRFWISLMNGERRMTKNEVPSVNPKLDAMCEMLKTIHDLSERNKMLEKQIEKMKCCSMCKHYSMSFLPYWCTKNNIAPHCTSKCDKWEIKQ